MIWPKRKGTLVSKFLYPLSVSVAKVGPTIARWDFVMGPWGWMVYKRKQTDLSDCLQNAVSIAGWEGGKRIPGDFTFLFPRLCSQNYWLCQRVGVCGWCQCVHILSSDTRRSPEYCRENERCLLPFVVVERPQRSLYMDDHSVEAHIPQLHAPIPPISMAYTRQITQTRRHVLLTIILSCGLLLSKLRLTEYFQGKKETLSSFFCSSISIPWEPVLKC